MSGNLNDLLRILNDLPAALAREETTYQDYLDGVPRQERDALSLENIRTALSDFRYEAIQTPRNDPFGGGFARATDILEGAIARCCVTYIKSPHNSAWNDAKLELFRWMHRFISGVPSQYKGTEALDAAVVDECCNRFTTLAEWNGSAEAGDPHQPMNGHRQSARATLSPLYAHASGGVTEEPSDEERNMPS